jgi:hypothetical protein
MQRKPFLLILLSLILAFSLGPERSILAQTSPIGPGGTTAIEAAITPVMSYQGRLVEAGAPVTGIRSMTFSLYNAASAGTLIWSEAQSVNVTNGLFQVTLGSITPISEAIVGQMDQNLWLEINVAGTILNRQQLMGSPYAFSLAPGAEVTGGTARALSVGNTGSGVGLWSHSTASHGVTATSTGVGLDGAALLAQGYDKGGIAAWALNEGTDATLVVSNNGEGPLIKGFGGDGGEHEFAILNDGTFQQELEASGLVKAAVYALCDDGGSAIIRSFSTVGGTMSITYGSAGTCKIDFGFPVTGRYFSVTAPALASHPVPTFAVCAMDITAYGTDALVCVRQFHDGTADDGYFMIVVY